MTDSEKFKGRQDLAVKFGLSSEDRLFHKAFDCTMIKKGAKGSKGVYANSALATVGDGVLKLYFAKSFFNEDENSGEITRKRIEQEKDKALKEKAEKQGFPRLRYGEKAKESDKLNSDFATLFEAVVGAIFFDGRI